MSIERPSFPRQRLSESYDTEQVDLAVEMVLENLALPEPRIDRSDIEGLRFAPVWRGGYSMTAVDDWLDEVVAELDRRHGVLPEAAAAAPSTPAPGAAPNVGVDLAAPGPDVDSDLVRLLARIAVVVVVAVLLYVTFA